jgi:hypothetical protein
MSYYILPKIPNIISIEICMQKEALNPYISHSLDYYYNDTIKLIDRLCKNETDPVCSNIEELSKIVNPYEYIFSKVTGSKFSVSKIKPFSNIFYDFLEISHTLNMFDLYNDTDILSLHFGENCGSSIECINMIREENNDTNLGFNSVDECIADNNKFNDIHFLFYEHYSEKNKIIGLINFLIKLLQKQKSGGSCIIKIDNLFYKPMVDIVYLLSSLYDKLYVIKPNTSPITSCEKYIVCKYFTCNYEKINLYSERLFSFLKTFEKMHNNDVEVSFLIKDEIPYYFINKIEEANIIVGQQQLESLDQIVSILKNKNKEDKIETLKKNNLQKCIHWCEKYRIPYNKFSEKVNIFLPFFKNVEDVEDEIELDNETQNVVIELFTNEEKFD